MNDFSVYYQVYNNIEWTTKVLTQFRKIYPNIHIRLLSDKGADHSELSTQMNCEYIYSNYHMGLWGYNHKDVISKKHCYGWNKEESIEYINRWYDFAKSIKTKYILMMEDDIYITKKISIIDTDFSFTQLKPGHQLNTDLKNICLKFNHNHTVDKYGCCAGNFINREIYIECIDKCFDFIKDNYDELYLYDTRLGWADTLNNLIFNLNGYDGIENTDYFEGLSNLNNKSIFHDHTGRIEKWNNVYNIIEK